jgi:hypothetical protein
MAVDDNGYETEDETGDKPQWRKELEQQARAGREALARAEAAERKLAIHGAGIDLDSPTGKMFMDAYKGAADIDAVRAKAAEYGLSNTQQAAPTTLTPEQEAAYAKMDQASQPPMGQPEENDQAVSALTNLSPWGPDGQLDPHGKDKIAEEFIRMGGSLSNEKPGDWVQIGSTPVPGNPGR